jgi:hypothetical protein
VNVQVDSRKKKGPQDSRKNSRSDRPHSVDVIPVMVSGRNNATDHEIQKREEPNPRASIGRRGHAGLLTVGEERQTRIAAHPSAHPEVSVVGDIAWITEIETNSVLPQLGSVALQSGERAGKNIAKRLAGEDAKPFDYTTGERWPRSGAAPPLSNSGTGER